MLHSPMRRGKKEGGALPPIDEPAAAEAKGPVATGLGSEHRVSHDPRGPVRAAHRCRE